ncbi:unnamed protein product, partial [Effrenium voratum]
ATASAVSAVLDSCAGSDAGISLALVVGQRAFAGAAPGSASSRARCWRVTESGAQATKEVLSHDFAESGPAHLVLAIGELGDLEMRDIVLPHLSQGRPRAASLTLLRRSGSAASVGCMRLAAHGAGATLTGQPAAKRQRVVGVDAREVPGRVRVRQILLRTWRGGSAPKPEDPVRRKSVQRSQEEAEGEMLKVMDGLLASKDGASLAKNFTSACRVTSECPSSLQGGELAGDLGWLDKDKGIDAKRANGKMVRPAVPAPVLRVAFELEVGELSDLVSSEVGVHLLLRSA